MKDFNEYAENAKNQGLKPDSVKNNLFSMVNSLAKKFDGKSQQELLSAIYKEAKSGKQKGTLSNSDIDNFVNTMSPFLDEKKRGLLLKIAKELKKI